MCMHKCSLIYTCARLCVCDYANRHVHTYFLTVNICVGVCFFFPGVKLGQCGADGIVEIVADQNTSLTCSAEGTVEWRFIGLHNEPYLLIANCTEGDCTNAVSGNLNELFQVQDRYGHDSMITINTKILTRLYDKVLSINSSVVCILMSSKLPVNTTARCELNYVRE